MMGSRSRVKEDVLVRMESATTALVTQTAGLAMSLCVDSTLIEKSSQAPNVAVQDNRRRYTYTKSALR
jgi:hypothetical protein